MKRVIAISILFTVLFIASFAFANGIPYTQEDRDRLVRVEAKLEAMEKRFDSLEKQFDSEIKQLREDMNSQFNRLAAIFTALVVFTLGFAIWDRRTMVRPFEDKVKKIEDDIAENRNKLHALIDALKTLSKTDEKVADVLKKFNLL
jgi:Mg2+ and Co2+ transporter CorA